MKNSSDSSLQEMMLKLKNEIVKTYKLSFHLSPSPIMRGNKFEKSHIHILESETLSRESRVTESAQEIVDLTPYDRV